MRDEDMEERAHVRLLLLALNPNRDQLVWL